MMIRTNPNPKTQRNILGMYVKSEYRNNQIAQKFIENIIIYAKIHNIILIDLTFVCNNIMFINLYQKLGF
jgi:GNAT superfamily N-acetyltransferase